MSSLPPMNFITIDSPHYEAKIIQRLFKYRIIDENGCWVWQKHINVWGYGTITFKEKDWLAHRLAFELIGRKSLTPELVLDHLCRNRSCINPDHLEEVTLSENIMRGNAPAAINARKKECNQGHSLNADNIIWEKGNRRACKTCRQSRNQMKKGDNPID